MGSAKKVFWSIFFGLTLLCGVALCVDDDEDETPGVTSRVSRISFIRGDVQIKREGSQDWEKAILNLPIVEGDEITTGAGARVEIQLNITSYIRITENSYLKVSGLQEAGIVLSLSEGSLNVRLTEFNKDTAFFEIDAPKTTVAIQRAGMYRIDAGAVTSAEVRVITTEDGEARVYSDNAGFTIRNNRMASVKLDGPAAGEWAFADVVRYYDEFDEWSVNRDSIIAQRLKVAYYNKYYDQDIYGAEDLTDNGEWVNLRNYGYVWRPYRSAVASYADWTPYRYGHWRWVPPYGWTWVNDEPWGWATYHHGRWFYDRGQWYWTPYGYQRRSRSWWFPALIGVTIINHNICWYPLPHGYGYYNYNSHFGGWGGPRGGHNGGPRGGGPRGGWSGNNGSSGGSGGNSGSGGPVPTPTPPGYVGPLPGQLGPSIFTNNESRRAWFTTPPFLRVPPEAVVATPLSSFGRDTTGIVTATATEAKAVLTKSLAQNEPVRILPTYQELDGKVGAAIKIEKPRLSAAPTKSIGVAVRNTDGGPVDRTLQQTKIYGEREPVRPEPDRGMTTGPRKTGAVTRDPVKTFDDAPVKPEIRTERTKPNRSDPIRPEPSVSQPSKPRETRTEEPVRQQPRVEAPQKQRDDPVRQPRNDPPPTKSEPTKTESPSKRDPPPSKSEPSKSEPSKPAPAERKSKDG